MGHNVKVVFPYIFKERDDAHALACISTEQILLADKCNSEPLPEAKIAEDLLHEICHHVSQIVTGDVCLGGDEQRHAMICRLLFAAIRDNRLDFSDRA
jgi:hypothetical protein